MLNSFLDLIKDFLIPITYVIKGPKTKMKKWKIKKKEARTKMIVKVKMTQMRKTLMKRRTKRQIRTWEIQMLELSLSNSLSSGQARTSEMLGESMYSKKSLKKIYLLSQLLSGFWIESIQNSFNVKWRFNRKSIKENINSLLLLQGPPIIKPHKLLLRNKHLNNSKSKLEVEELIVEGRAISNTFKTMRMMKIVQKKKKIIIVRSNLLQLIEFPEAQRKFHLQSQLVEEEAGLGRLFNQRKRNRAMMMRRILKSLLLSLKMKIDSGKIAALSVKEQAVYYAAMDAHKSLIFLA